MIELGGGPRLCRATSPTCSLRSVVILNGWLVFVLNEEKRQGLEEYAYIDCWVL